ncbi:TlpA family protein disulfide reductase [Thermodesulfobacteriota bacterium]
MTRFKSLLVVLVICALSLSATFAVASSEGADFIGKKVPSFVAKDLDGKDVDIKSFEGKPVLVNFWGLRCGACIEEMPHLNNLFDKYTKDGLVILGINTDGIDSEFLKSPRGMANLPAELKYTVIEDPEGKLIDLFKMDAAPLNIIVDKKGNVTFYHVGYEAGDEKILEEKVKEALK